MYLNFFSLNKEPFQVTPDPSFLYLSQGHKEALASIIYGVEKKKGFVLIVGAVGVGKTTILRAYLERADKESLRTIYLFNSNISYNHLLKFIFKELGIVPSSDEVPEMVNQLHEVLVEEYRQGRNVLLLIDEAQNMPVDTLENLRMLSNLETATEKLLQIVFSAQPEFEETLNLEVLRQLRQRIAVKAVIYPLTSKEGLTYIQHRLKRASDKDAAIFTKYALKEIVRTSKGIPRLINVLCDNSLITAFGYGNKKVGLKIVREIVKDFGMKQFYYARWGIALVVIAILVITYIGFKESKAVMSEKNMPPRAANVQQHHNPIDSVSPKVLNNEPSSDQKVAYVHRIVERGDTLAKLIVQVYGQVDSQMIRLVKKANPSIYDENLILEGSKIIFPVKKNK